MHFYAGKLKKYEKQYYNCNKGRHKVQYKQYYKKKYFEIHKKEKGEYHLLRTYNIDIKQFETMLKSQNNKCEIYGKKFWNTMTTRSYIDHNHISGAPGGILCLMHNFEIGYYERMSNYADIILKYITNKNYNIRYPSSERVKRHRKQVLEK